MLIIWGRWWWWWWWIEKLFRYPGWSVQSSMPLSPHKGFEAKRGMLTGTASPSQFNFTSRMFSLILRRGSEAKWERQLSQGNTPFLSISNVIRFAEKEVGVLVSVGGSLLAFRWLTVSKSGRLCSWTPTSMHSLSSFPTSSSRSQVDLELDV